MKAHPGPLLGLLATTLAAGLMPARASAQEFKLTPKAYPKWTINVPNEVWTAAAAQIPIPHAEGEGFAVSPDGESLAVDTNANGRLNGKVKGAYGFLKLKSDDSEGNPLVYGLRFRKRGKVWEYAASGAMTGKVNGVGVKVIDLNTNGVYNEYGVDAMVVGGGKSASYLSKVLNLKGELYSFEISKNGRTVKIDPYDGESGTLDLRSKFRSKGKLVSVVVSDESGAVSFNLAGAKGGMKVPVGKYSISGGLAKKGGESAQVKSGRMPAMNVEVNNKFVLDWGGPVKADFTYSVLGEQITVKPDVKYYGKAGEEYFNWNPDAKSPKIFVADASNEKVVASGRFPSC